MKRYTEPLRDVISAQFLQIGVDQPLPVIRMDELDERAGHQTFFGIFSKFIHFRVCVDQFSIPAENDADAGVVGKEPVLALAFPERLFGLHHFVHVRHEGQ